MCGVWGVIRKTAGNCSDAEAAEDFARFRRTAHRGPDSHHFHEFCAGTHSVRLGFHRLAIIDVAHGDQPFVHDTPERRVVAVCNGEIYNFRALAAELGVQTMSDCRVVVDAYIDRGAVDAARALDGEFAFAIIDMCKRTQRVRVYLARDRFGIRPMFFAFDAAAGVLHFASELKSMPPGGVARQLPPRAVHVFDIAAGTHDTQTYYTIGQSVSDAIDADTACVRQVREALVQSVRDRLESERPIGCLLSGGLDSSLVAAIAAQALRETGRRLRTFSIGMPGSPDSVYAQLVADHIGSDHTCVIIEADAWISAVPDVIAQIETYDTTTVRASTGQYLIGKWIAENTDVRVLLNGDGSDEIAGGYLYFYNAPSAEEAHTECVRLLNEIHFYDVLRVDRGLSAHGLEARVPFLAHRFVDTYLATAPALRAPRAGVRAEKQLLRDAFSGTGLLPDAVLWRRKEAFSDGVSDIKQSWYQIIAQNVETDVNARGARNLTCDFLAPPTPEARYYRWIFDALYPGCARVLETARYWLPRWSGNVVNPSARVLDVYYET